MEIIDRIKDKIDDYMQTRKVKYCLNRTRLYGNESCICCKYNINDNECEVD